VRLRGAHCTAWVSQQLESCHAPVIGTAQSSRTANGVAQDWASSTLFSIVPQRTGRLALGGCHAAGLSLRHTSPCPQPPSDWQIGPWHASVGAGFIGAGRCCLSQPLRFPQLAAKGHAVAPRRQQSTSFLAQSLSPNRKLGRVALNTAQEYFKCRKLTGACHYSSANRQLSPERPKSTVRPGAHCVASAGRKGAFVVARAAEAWT
jgi:hypothetical protein